MVSVLFGIFAGLGLFLCCCSNSKLVTALGVTCFVICLFLQVPLSRMEERRRR